VNLDPYWAQEATLDLWSLGLPAEGNLRVADVLSGDTYESFGSKPYVRLDPLYRVAHVFDLSALSAARDLGGIGDGHAQA